jgi:hypothetical protein
MVPGYYHNTYKLFIQKIEDFLEDKSEITVYSVEYGLNLKTLANERDRLHVNYSVFDQNVINEKFISKKTMRDKKNMKKSNTNRTTEINGDDEFENPPIGTLETHDNNQSPQIPKNREIKIKDQKQQKNTEQRENKEITNQNLKQIHSQNPHNTQNTQNNNKQKLTKINEKNPISEKKKSKIKHDDSADDSCKFFLI